MPSNRKNSREHTLVADQTLIDGIQRNKASLPATFPVGTQTFKPDDVVVLLQKRIDTGKAVIAAETTHEAAIKAERDTRQQTKLVIDTFRKLIILLFLQLPDALGTFGLTAPRPRKQSAAGKASAAAKGSAKRRRKQAAIAAADAGATAPAPEAAPAPAPAPATAPAAAVKPAS